MRNLSIVAFVFFATSLISQAQEKITVVTSLPPLASLTQNILGVTGNTSAIVTGSSSPHGFQMRPSHVSKLSNADLVIWNGNNAEPFLKKSIEKLSDGKILDLSKINGLMEEYEILERKITELNKTHGAKQSYPTTPDDNHEHDDHSSEHHESEIHSHNDQTIHEKHEDGEHTRHHDHDDHSNEHDETEIHSHNDQTIHEKHEDGEHMGHHDHDDHSNERHETEIHSHNDQTIHEEHEDGEHTEHHHHEEGALDMHFWLSTTKLKTAATAIADFLVKNRPSESKSIKANLQKVLEEIESLDHEVEQKLAGLTGVPFVTYHDAYSYLTLDYKLNQVGVFTINPEFGTTIGNTDAVVNMIKKHDGKLCVMGEPQFDNKLILKMESLYKVEVSYFDPLGANIPPNQDMFLNLIRDNMTRLANCLQQAKSS